jgi:outer membrane protein assembly factor BamD
LYYRLKAAHDLAVKSTTRRKEQRVKDAIKAYEKLKRNFPKTKYIKESNKMLATLEKEQKQLVKS